MSDLKRYRINWHMEETYLSGDGAWCMFDDVQSELAALREENRILQKQLGDRWGDISALKETVERLTAAEQSKNLELVELLMDARWRIVNKNTSTDDYKRLDKPVVDRIDAALKPTESGASE